ncbi:DUF4097 family beta strand repeat-containing protein [Actinacidiphila glaucinigra]|uniref:DUF4097 family beta strand repeat-containing protein n=1 Tax=Actinacidiphila glaucinigra TaxID=235986 RepID=UPI0033C783AB
MVKSWRAMAIVLALAAAGFLPSCDTGGDGAPGADATGSAVPSRQASSGGATDGSSPRSYEVSGAKALDVRNENGSVRITVGSGPISVTETLEYGAVKPATRHRVEGGTLRLVGSGCGNSRPCRVDYVVRVPPATPVTVRVDNGEAEADGVTGAVDLGTGNGSVTGTALGARRASLTSENGAVEASFEAAPEEVTATTGNGMVTVTVPAGTAYDVRARTGVGMRQVSVPTDASSSRRITATTGNGMVTVQTG